VANELILLVGSYTQPEAHVPMACGEGIVTCSFNFATGRIEKRSVFKDILNPSYLAWDPACRAVFAVSENIHSEGCVWQFACDDDGVLTPRHQQRSHGAATCHVAVLPGPRVGAASYFGGCLAVYPVEAGALAPADRVFHYQGSGPDSLRQEASHAHQTVLAPNDRWFYVCDLGSDRVWQHDAETQEDPVGLVMPPGLGPRHMVFHPGLSRAWVLGELTGAVATCDWDSGTGSLEVVATTDDIEADASAAAIRVHPSGRALWISRRKHPALRVFPLDEHGIPGEPAEILLEKGEPRDFAISPDGRWLVSANQGSDELVVVELDPLTGLPLDKPLQHFPVGTPVCVLFIDS
jgi:6-phosphogluconolactonase